MRHRTERFSEAHVQKMLELRAKGWTHAQIGKELGFHRTTIYKQLKKLKRRPIPPPPEPTGGPQELYTGEPEPAHVPGAFDFLAIPSRYGDLRVFRDGRREHSPIGERHE